MPDEIDLRERLEKEKNVRLIELRLRNFKGLRDFTFRLDGEDASAFGRNATGKTTLADSFLWLLFGKDSLNKSDFELKPLKSTGEPEHFLETEVEGILDIDGTELTLKKIYKEIWTKRRGAADRTFEGHSCDCWVNDVPTPKRQYESVIAEIIPEDAFRMLTNPRHFSENLKWTERRTILLSVCGDVSDSDVIAGNAKLSPLPDILGKHSLDDYRKILAGKRTEINKQLSDIPIRVSEQKRNVLDAGIQEGAVRAKLADLQKDKAAQDTILATMESGGSIAEKKRELAEVEAKLIALQNKDSQQLNDALEVKRTDLNRMKFGLGALEADSRKYSAKIAENSISTGLNLRRMDELRTEWNTLNASAFEAPDTCPTCGQTIPEDQIEATRATFNINRAEGLKGINAEGMKLKEIVGKLEAENVKHGEELTKKQAEIEKLSDAIRALEEKINQPVQLGVTPERQKLRDQESDIHEALLSLSENIGPAVAKTKAQILALETQISDHNNTLAQIGTNKTALARVSALKAEERRLAAELEKLESELFLTEEFVRVKVAMLEEKINSRFQFARFKLFDQQVNGGLAECCEITVNGVPYWSANNAARINAGIDVANVLSEHYGIAAPMWLDNAEAVNEILPSKSQQIRLVVSEDKTLRIEAEGENTRKAA